MLVELRVRSLGVVEDGHLFLGRGLTAITGETGAGKTLLTEAIRLLIGGRAEPHVVRSGVEEATIEGRFTAAATSSTQEAAKASDPDTQEAATDEEHVLTRIVSSAGRSRAYIDGRMATIAALADMGAGLVDLHGQNTSQLLLSPAAQRSSLDAFAGISLDEMREARRQVRRLDTELEQLGGDSATRLREMDLLRYQLDELDAAQLTDADEDDRLLEEEQLLADATAHREAAETITSLLSGDGGVSETLARAVKNASSRPPLASLLSRLLDVATEVDDLSSDAAAAAERFEDNPERLAEVQQRRAQLKTLERKYGPDLERVIAFRDDTGDRLRTLESHDERVEQLSAERELAQAALRKAEEAVGAARRGAAPALAAEVESRLKTLAMPNARFEVKVGDGAGEDVQFLLGANPGMPLLPLAKAASGGEQARSMLALRLALLGTAAPEQGNAATTMIFDEVDAGIGGEAAIAVGRALSTLASSDPSLQVLVVTHLPQVAAFADSQISVEKKSDGKRTSAEIRILDDSEREVELARMLSGRPDSTSGRAHARELLAQRFSSELADEIDLRDARTTGGARTA